MIGQNGRILASPCHQTFDKDRLEYKLEVNGEKCKGTSLGQFQTTIARPSKAINHFGHACRFHRYPVCQSLKV